MGMNYVCYDGIKYHKKTQPVVEPMLLVQSGLVVENPKHVG